MKNIKTYLKKNKINIILSLLVSLVVAWLLGLNRTYNAFGGEDLIPIATVMYWLFKYLEDTEKK